MANQLREAASRLKWTTNTGGALVRGREGWSLTWGRQVGAMCEACDVGQDPKGS